MYHDVACSLDDERVPMSKITACCHCLLFSLLAVACVRTTRVQQQPAAEQYPLEAECFTMDVEDPSALFMLGRGIQGETLILTNIGLNESPGTREGYRAFFGIEQWLASEPLRPFSWYWVPRSDNSVRIGFVLPLWSVVWDAERTRDGLNGTATYRSDEVGEPRRSTAFSALRIACPRDS